METQRLEKGNDFLKNMSMAYLKKRHRKEKDPKARDRLLACIMRKNGMPVRDIAAQMNRSYSTVRGWLVRMRDEGLRGRYDIRREGPECRLDQDQITELLKDIVAGPDKCGFETKLWNSRLVAAYIEQRFGVRYTTRAVQYLLVRYGFSWRKLRQDAQNHQQKP